MASYNFSIPLTLQQEMTTEINNKLTEQRILLRIDKITFRLFLPSLKHKLLINDINNRSNYTQALLRLVHSYRIVMLLTRDTLKPIVLIGNIFYITTFAFIDLHINPNVITLKLTYTLL